MTEIEPSIPLEEKNRTFAFPWITATIALLTIGLLLGIYLYATEPDSQSQTETRKYSVPFEQKKETIGGSRPVPGNAGTSPGLPETEEIVAAPPDGLNPETELPALTASDPFVRDRLGALSGRAEFAKWIGIQHLVPKFAMLVDNVAKGAAPAAKFRDLAPEGKFSAIEKSPDQYLMDPQGYHRYDIFAETFASLDPSAMLGIYREIEPLLDSAYQELGYPEGQFEPALRNAIRHLLSAPVLSGEIALVRPSVTYRFADPQLESLSRAKKQLIRMGPRNTRMIQAALANFLSKLDPSEPPAQE